MIVVVITVMLVLMMEVTPPGLRLGVAILCEGGASAQNRDQSKDERKAEQLWRDGTCHVASVRPLRRAGLTTAAGRKHTK
jgi:hypothetical protein